MGTKDAIGMDCLYAGQIWEIVSIANNMLGTFYGIKRHGQKKVVKEEEIVLIGAQEDA